MLKGTLVLVPFPFTDLSGHKVRPALVLHDSLSGEDCIVAFISSQKQKRLERHDIAAEKSDRNGLKIDSIIKVAKIATLQKKIILGELGVLEDALQNEVDTKLRQLFDI